MFSSIRMLILLLFVIVSLPVLSNSQHKIWQLQTVSLDQGGTYLTSNLEVDSLSEGDELLVELPGFTMYAQVEKIRMFDEVEHIELAIPDDRLLKHAHLFVEADSTLRAWIPTSKGVYVVRNGQMSLAENQLVGALPIPLTQSSASLIEFPRLGEIQAFPEPLIEIQNETVNSDEIVDINMLFVVSEEFAEEYPNTRGRINEYVQVANSIFEDSGVLIRIRVSSVIQADFEDLSSSQAALAVAFKTGSGSTFTQEQVDNIIDERLRTQADFVTLMKLNTTETFRNGFLCGVVMGTEAVSPDFADSFEGGIGLVNDSVFEQAENVCSEDSVARVFGLNGGLTTSINNPSEPEGSILSYGRGFREDGVFRTLLAQEESNLGEPSLPIFSSPDNTCLSLPCGIAPGLPGEADARTALNLTRFSLGRKFDENNPNFEFDTALEQVVDPNLSECIRNEGINLNLFNLIGVNIPPDVVTEVTSLDCEDTTISSLDGLQNFFALSGLSVSGNGALDVAPINTIERLQALVMSGVSENSFSDFGDFPFLFIVAITRSNLTTLPNISSENLGIASFEDNQISSIDEFESFVNYDSLFVLDLENNIISDFSGLAGAPALVALGLEGNPINSLFPLTFLSDTLIELGVGVDNLTCQEITAAQLTWGRTIDFDFVGDCISLADDFEDFDGDGINNLNDADDDGDGINDISDFLPRNPSNANDNDLDGIPNDEDRSPNGTGNPGDGPSTTPEPQPEPEPEPQPEPGPSPTNASVLFDFDGDGSADVAVRRASIFRQFVLNSSDEQIQRVDFGRRINDIPVSGDFDGDGIADIGVRRPSTQQWFIRNSSGQDIITNNADGITRLRFGRNANDIPVLADFDGDGLTDIAVRRPSTQQWFIRNSSGEDLLSNNEDGISRIRFGLQASDIPVVADYDGDGRADIAVRRPSTQQWFILNSSGVDPLTSNSDGITRRRFGTQPNDIPVAADFDGDGRADLAVRRPSTESWFVLNSSGTNFNSSRGDGIQRVTFGRNPEDIPIVADYDGDGITDFAVRRASSQFQFILRSSDGGIDRIQFGRNTMDIPLAAPILTRMEMASSSR